jgi:hypothetical protein
MSKKLKGTHKALGRGGRARVIEVTIKQPVRKPGRARWKRR